ncbi:MAG: hypothetical protein PHT91_03550 [Candidatus Nanoarchaeia archaeon]|nr:hypothetical protein [Candidatus Nanoarchaeia archaeon]MDD5053963.1 hypothetical protein [Candidatus Nanoarchaeia archaeon]MDD5499920.1 hypothetical protein [Candidatus Nanoarchaeia archaeon]
MVLWVLSFITGLIIISSMYFALQLSNFKLRAVSAIVLLLLLVGETFDMIAELVLDEFILLIPEAVELFVVLGFFSMLYYIYGKKEYLKKIREEE